MNLNMSDIVNSVLSHTDSLRWLFFLGLLFVFYRWMQSDDSTGIEWKDFVSTRGMDGKFHGDINKLGQSTGIFIGSVALVQIAPQAHNDFTGFALVLTSYFAFVGGASGYAAYLRSKQQGSVTTSTVTEPVPDPSVTKTTKTVVETEPTRT